MVRPHSTNGNPASLFRVIKVPVARHHQDGTIKPNPTIVKRLGGYHRRVITKPDDRNKRSFISLLKNTIRRLKNVFRLPSSPLLRRIEELEDDIRLLRQKNEILEKGYTFGPSNECSNDSFEERSSINAKVNEDIASSVEGESTTATGTPKTGSESFVPDMETGEGREIAPIRDTPSDASLAIPIPPPAPPVIAVGQKRPSAIVGVPPGTSSVFEPLATSCPIQAVTASEKETPNGINLKDILSVKLKPVQQGRQADSFRVGAEELFSIPLKPVSRRGRPPVREHSGSDNEEFTILRAAMKRRIESLYSPSLSAAASDTDWSVSPNFRSGHAARTRNGAAVQG